MSLVSTYVQSLSGLWYENPTCSADGWFICWDDDEPIELVIKDSSGIKPSDVLKMMGIAGWKLEIWYKGSKSMRLFGDGEDPKINFENASAYFLKQLKGGPPDSHLKCRTAPTEKMPRGQGVYYYNQKDGHRPQNKSHRAN